MSIAVLLITALAGSGAFEEPTPEWIQARLGELESSDAALWSRSLEALLELGPDGAFSALGQFDAASVRGQRSRARLVEEVGGTRCLPAVLARMGHADPEVRLAFVRFLGSPALGDERRQERVDVLRELVVADPQAEVRQAALRSLAGFGDADAAQDLDRLLDRLPPGETGEVAKVLRDLPAARQRLVERVRTWFEQGSDLPVDTLALFLERYGHALAGETEGGDSPQERAPLVQGRNHPDPQVRRAARQALEGLLSRLSELGELERSDRLLAQLSQDGLDRRELVYRRAFLSLSQRDDLALAAECSRELLREVGASTDPQDLQWRFFGLHFGAVTRFAEGDYLAALRGFEAAKRVLHESLAERRDLWPQPLSRSRQYPRAPVGGALMLERLFQMALLDLWQSLAWLAGGGEERFEKALSHLRQAHQTLLSAQLLGLNSDVDAGTDNWDLLLERDLAPRRLLFGNRKLDPESRWVELQVELGQALKTVSAWEFPGFEPLPVSDPVLTSCVVDPERFRLLRAIQVADLGQADRQREFQRKADPSRLDLLSQINFRLRDTERKLRSVDRQAEHVDFSTLDREGERDAFGTLLDYRSPSQFAYNLALDLRAEGRARQARELSQRMLDDLRSGLPGAQSYWTEWVSARLEMSVASSWMDENEPARAEAVGIEAVRRLEALENTFEERAKGLPQGDTILRRLNAYLNQTRVMRSGALLSLAVNANVRLDDQDKALDYFEQAYELDQNDFMRVLLACYRARSGKRTEALAILRQVGNSPRLYYNLACTHALLGDTELALDYLQRELSENHPTRGSLERQKKWAREDPDLLSLRDNARFLRLTEPR